MSLSNQKNKLITYLGIGFVLLLGVYTADYMLPGIDIFKSKNVFYQSQGTQTHPDDTSDNNTVFEAPPQPQPVANRPEGRGKKPNSDSIKHNFNLAPETLKKYSQFENGRNGNVHKTTITSESVFTGRYGARFRLAQNQNAPVRASDSGGSDSGGDDKDKNDDEPAYFDAPTVQPSQQSTSQATRGTSESGDQALVVVRNEDSERKLESTLQAGKRALRMKRYDAALSFFNELYQDYSEEPRVLMGRAIALQRLGRHQAARNAYKVLLDNDPDNVHAQINLYGIVKNTKPGLALRQLKKIHENHPDNAELAAQIGLVSAEIQKYDQASQYLERAASMAPDNPKHFYNLGIVEEYKGNIEKAIKYYEQAVDKMAVSGKPSELSKNKIYDRLSQLRDS